MDARRPRHYLSEGVVVVADSERLQQRRSAAAGYRWSGQSWSVRLVSEGRRPAVGVDRGTPCVSREGRCGQRGGFFAAAAESPGRDHVHRSGKLFTGWSLARPCRRWLRAETHVYVSPFPFGAGGHRKIMNESGSSPVWSRSGGEIFLITTDGQFKALRISTNPAPDWGNPQALFRAQGTMSSGSGSTNYDVTRDGRQLLIVTPSDAGSRSRIPRFRSC